MKWFKEQIDTFLELAKENESVPNYQRRPLLGSTTLRMAETVTAEPFAKAKPP